ncbi:MAG: helix-turn-helix domain-containing protein [Saprospiraceae bacterium]|nr:helix-turn-helix domain-containing protein [Saprospiraceae bacterium]
MEIPLTLTVILLGAILSQGVFAASLLIIHPNNRKSNLYLGFLLIAFSLWLLDDFFNAAFIYQQNPDFYFLPIYFSFAFGPLIYLYTRSLTESDFVFTKSQLLHFIPVGMQTLLYIGLQGQDYSYRRWFWQEIHFPYTYNIEFVGSLISLVIYLFLSLIVVRKYQVWIKNQFSEISKINLNWLKLIFGVLTFICFVWIIDTLLRFVWQYYPMHDFSAISMGISVLVLAGGALLQSSLGKTRIETTKIKDKKIEKEVEIDPQLLDKIQSKMEENKYFLNPSLTLNVFANDLNESSRKVSSHINHGIGKTFIDFVNEYRVNEFKSKIDEGKLAHLTLTGIAFECGFNSKATFNRVFKNISGQSPSSYLKETQSK